MSTQVEKRSDVSELIVDAAERLLRTYGYQKMTMTDLAAEAGIGVGTTYLHFTSKAEVVLAVAERSHKAILCQMRNIEESENDPREKLHRVLWIRVQARYEKCREVLATVSWQQFHRHGTEFKTDIKTTDPTRPHVWRQAEADVIRRVIDSGIAQSIFLPVESNSTAATLLLATCGFMPIALEQEDFQDPVLFEARVKSVISLLINGMTCDKHSNFEGVLATAR